MREVWAAPAKINLSLEITGRRDDGYHTVDTVYQAIDLIDTVTLASQPNDEDVTCIVEGPAVAGVPDGDDNLAARAARLIAERTGHDVRVAITIDKRIPAGAGLGGGSSDAAAVLVALAQRFAVPDPRHTLIEIAAELGADVPFFLDGGTQRATGIGERLTSVDPPGDRWGIVAYPGVPVSTRWAFREYDAGLVTEATENAFEPLVIATHPEVAHALDVLRRGSARTAMSGSGSAVFALYTSAAARDADLDRVRAGIAELSGSRAWPVVCVDHGVRRLAVSENPA